ncbi:MAG: fasciclin domain-containing protein, partial [Chromatiales bacterium]
ARALVEAHAVRGKLSATDLLVADSTRSVSGQVLPLNRADEIRVADAAVMVTEVAENGVVHVIDTVL